APDIPWTFARFEPLLTRLAVRRKRRRYTGKANQYAFKELLAEKRARGHDPGRMGGSLRRLRPLLPRQVRGRRYRRDRLYRCRLHVARWRNLPLPRLQEPAEESCRLHTPYAGSGADFELAAADMCLPAPGGRKGHSGMAPAHYGRSGKRASGG